MMQPNTKIQRTGAEIFLLQLNLLPAADLERSKDLAEIKTSIRFAPHFS
jgi:hypothetical protein